MSSAPFRKGGIYQRSRIHVDHGGQPRRGISTPRRSPFVFAFSGGNGQHRGYKDRWDGTRFLYYGEWPTNGDEMKFVGGNRAIRDHQRMGKELWLFEMLPTGKGRVHCLGQFECCGWRLEAVSDSSGSRRIAIVFELVEVEQMRMAS